MSGKEKHIIPPEELMAFMDGQLNLARRKKVEKHLKTCPECRSLLESLELAERQVARAEKVEAPEGYFATFSSRVANRIAGRELARAPRPWLLRWGWMPAAAAAAFAAVMVLSRGFYDQPMVHQAALERKVIPIPIAPEPRVPETVAVLETYYEEATAVLAAESASSEKDGLAASGSSQPAPAAAPNTDEISADEVSAVSRTRAASTPGLVDMAGAPSAPAAPPSSAPATTPDAKLKIVGSVAKRSAPQAFLEAEVKTQPPSTPAPLPEAKELEPVKSDDRDKVERAGVPVMAEAKRRLVRIRQVGASRVLLPGSEPPDTCSLPDVSSIEAIVIHLPDGGQSPPPEIEPALRICLPQ
jgi:hypothetical protein